MTTNPPNIFEIAAHWKGTITPAQERALNGFVTRMGRVKFLVYRNRAKVGRTPIPRLSKQEASRLIELIKQDLEGANSER